MGLVGPKGSVVVSRSVWMDDLRDGAMESLADGMGGIDVYSAVPTMHPIDIQNDKERGVGCPLSTSLCLRVSWGRD